MVLNINLKSKRKFVDELFLEYNLSNDLINGNKTRAWKESSRRSPSKRKVNSNFQRISKYYIQKYLSFKQDAFGTLISSIDSNVLRFEFESDDNGSRLAGFTESTSIFQQDISYHISPSSISPRTIAQISLTY